MKRPKRIFLAVIILAALGAFSLLLPPVRERVSWHANEWKLRLEYALNPPEKQVFVPQATPDIDFEATLLAMPPQPSSTPVVTVYPTFTPEIQATPTLTPTPLPAQAHIPNVPYVDQHGLWNYCAPANLAMALAFWGWPGDRTDVGAWVKPYEKDKNVMPYELADYVREQTALSVVTRSGGDLELIKRFVAAGFPVLVEKGAWMLDISGKVSWMGHYAVVNGYDDTKTEFLTQDSFYTADYPVSYVDLAHGWRAFNNVFMVVYPGERETEVTALLGDHVDETAALQIAAQTASTEIFSMSGVDQFFAWFNRGTSLVSLQDYYGAAQAYDQAFALYAQLPEADRPWRMMWYQTGPYFAYYYSGRYTDVVTLADQTIDAASEPYIEESWYWRALARNALGDSSGAVSDLRKSLEYHPGFAPSLTQFALLGIEP